MDINEKILEQDKKYENLRMEVETIFKKYDLKPMEIYRLANELQARSFEMFISALDNYVEERIKEAKK